MKKLIRTINVSGNDDASRLKEKLNGAGFYAISGIVANTVEVYAIEDIEYAEDKVIKITKRVIENHRGKLTFTMWGWFMRKIFLLLPVMAILTGCNGLDKLLGTEDKDHKTPKFYIVACCRDNNNGILTYPSFVPEAHQQLCESIRVAPDGQINGDTYLAVNGDCGHHGYVGDEYYAGKGY